jgi:hypothetical protein
MVPIINIKLTSIMENLARMALTNMDFAFEIYKLGKIIINSNLTTKNLDSADSHKETKGIEIYDEELAGNLNS